MSGKIETKTYGISFDTRNAAGLIRLVKVTIGEDVMDNDDVVDISLADHPLYKKLQEYVLANPR